MSGWRGVRMYLAMMVASIATMMFGSILISNMTIRQILSKEAVEQTESFISFLVASTDALPEFLAGDLPTTRTTSFLANTPRVGTLFRYALHDREGAGRFESDALDFGLATTGALQVPGPSVEQWLASRQPVVEIRFSEAGGEQDVISTVTMPIVIGGNAVGVAVASISQSLTYQHHSRQIRDLSLKIGGMSALVFALPLLSALWQMRMRQKADRKIARMAQYDALTGLLNRFAFTNRIEAMILRKEAFYIHLVDLDRFKQVNDVRGHGIGDLLLQEVGSRILQAAGPKAIVARLGGDEFAVVHARSQAPECDPRSIADAIVAELSRPFLLEGYHIEIGGSVGSAEAPVDGDTLRDILRAADTALYAAKNGGRSQAVMFTAPMDEARLARLALEARLREAVDLGQFELNFQPLFEASTSEICGFEALLRLKDPQGEPIPPLSFIPIAESIGLIEALGDWALFAACREARNWPAHFRVSVNISTIQFRSGALPDRVRTALDEAGLEPHRLCLEITEGTLIKETDQVMQQLRQLREWGVKIALDDFGTGYSSLSYLSSLPLDVLKIDKALVRNLTSPANPSWEITKAIIGLGRALNLTVTVEGVETEAQRVLLLALGCTHMQGFLLGRPAPASEIRTLFPPDGPQGQGGDDGPPRSRNRLAEASAAAPALAWEFQK